MIISRICRVPCLTNLYRSLIALSQNLRRIQSSWERYFRLESSARNRGSGSCSCSERNQITSSLIYALIEYIKWCLVGRISNDRVRARYTITIGLSLRLEKNLLGIAPTSPFRVKLVPDTCVARVAPSSTRRLSRVRSTSLNTDGTPAHTMRPSSGHTRESTCHLLSEQITRRRGEARCDLRYSNYAQVRGVLSPQGQRGRRAPIVKPSDREYSNAGFCITH